MDGQQNQQLPVHFVRGVFEIRPGETLLASRDASGNLRVVITPKRIVSASKLKEDLFIVDRTSACRLIVAGREP